MAQLNWNIFRSLPGADSTNFEKVWRRIIWSQYARYGDFRGKAHQPGVEFHLKLNQQCTLGDPGRWYGWQCKWHDIDRRVRLRREKIQDALTKTKKYLPELTDWVLCTPTPLGGADQDWFDELETEMQLHLWSEPELEAHLDEVGIMCRQTYFGELVLTPGLLKEIHSQSVAPISWRWQPDIHQELDAERIIRRYLGETTSWSDLSQLIEHLDSGARGLESIMSEITSCFDNKINALIQISRDISGSLRQIKKSLENGDREILKQELESLDVLRRGWNTLLCYLRGRGHRGALYATNLVADIHGAHTTCRDLKHAVSQKLVAVIAKAGCGKTQFSAQLTASTEDRPAGILLNGKNLQSKRTLDDLVWHITIQGKRVNNFDTLMAAVDAAGERSGKCLPIVIDGLNEAEDPRDWKDLLACLDVSLKNYPYVLIVCTLRPTFAAQALPPEVSELKMKGFERFTDDAIDRYFKYYRISRSQFRLPQELLSHPLTLQEFPLTACISSNEPFGNNFL